MKALPVRQPNIPVTTMSLACLLAWFVLLITLPIVILFWITESKQQKAKRMRNNGATYKAIANRINCSATTARRYCLS